MGVCSSDLAGEAKKPASAQPITGQAHMPAPTPPVPPPNAVQPQQATQQLGQATEKLFTERKVFTHYSHSFTRYTANNDENLAYPGLYVVRLSTSPPKGAQNVGIGAVTLLPSCLGAEVPELATIDPVRVYFSTEGEARTFARGAERNLKNLVSCPTDRTVEICPGVSLGMNDVDQYMKDNPMASQSREFRKFRDQLSPATAPPVPVSYHRLKMIDIGNGNAVSNEVPSGLVQKTTQVGPPQEAPQAPAYPVRPKDGITLPEQPKANSIMAPAQSPIAKR